MMFTRRNSVIFASVAIAIVAISSITLSENMASTVSSNSVEHGVAIHGLLDPWSVQDADNSLYIVKGTVKELKVTVDEEGKRFGDKPVVFTDAVIAIDEEFTGKYEGKEITVRTVGGQLSDYNTVSGVHAKFVQNEQVIVFIGYEPESEMGDNYFPMGHVMGKYELKDGLAIGKDYPEGLPEAQFISNIRK